MSLLDRYVFKAWLGAFLVSAGALIGLFLMVDLVAHMGKFLEAQNTNRLFLVFRYYAARLPVFFVWLAPMISLCAVMLVLARFTRSNELLPVLVSGRSARRFLAPAFFGVGAVSVLMFVVDEKVAPKLQEEWRETEAILKREAKTQNVVIADTMGQDWFAEAFHSLDDHLERALVIRVDNRFRRVWDVRAEKAFYTRSSRGWLMKNGVVTEYDPETQRRMRRTPIEAEGLLVKSDLRPADIEEAEQVFRTSTLKQLDRNIERFPYEPFWRVQWHSKWTMPVANMVLVILGAPLILRSGTKNVFAGVAMALGIGLVFFGAMIAFLDAGNGGRLDAVTAAWFPVILFGAAGVAMLDGIKT